MSFPSRCCAPGGRKESRVRTWCYRTQSLSSRVFGLVPRVKALGNMGSELSGARVGIGPKNRVHNWLKMLAKPRSALLLDATACPLPINSRKLGPGQTLKRWTASKTGRAYMVVTKQVRPCELRLTSVDKKKDEPLDKIMLCSAGPESRPLLSWSLGEYDGGMSTGYVGVE